MANIPTVSWNENSPANTDVASLGDDRIREFKTQFRELFGVDHDLPSSGQAADNGQHLRVTLQEQADLGSGATGKTILGGQTVSGKPELMYTDEDDNDVQITSAGKIKAESIAGVYPAANVAALATIMSLIYPVGSYYFNDSDSTNPGTLLGVGTWAAVEETVLVGYKSGSAEFGTPGGAYGAKTVTLTAAQSGVPVHTHSASVVQGGGDGAYFRGNESATQTGTPSVGANTAANAAEAHNNCQPSRTVYMWRRTA